MNTPRLKPSELKVWRERLGLSQREAEERVLFGRHHDGRMWRRWESGERAVPALLTYIRYWLPDLPAERPSALGGTTPFSKAIEK